MSEQTEDLSDVRNVVLLTVDSLRADHCSCYGYDRETTPKLDRFAKQGVMFDRAYSPSSHTRESVPSILTGCYPDEAIDEQYRLAAPNIPTLLPNMLQTGAFHSNPYLSRAFGFDNGFDAFDDDLHLGGWKITTYIRLAWDRLRNRFYARADEINDRSLSWLDDHCADGVFLWNHYMDPHDPYEPPREYAAEFGTTVQDDMRKQHKRAGNDPSSVSEAEQERFIDLYDAEIRYFDQRLGEFLDALSNRDLLAETLVILTADHGDAFGEHGYFGHPRRLHDELVHVPLVVVGPGFPEGETVQSPVSLVDIVPTIHYALGEKTAGFAGTALQEIEETPQDGRCVFSQASGEDDEDHVYRFAGRSSSGTRFLERHLETGEILDTVGDADSKLTDALAKHSLHHLPSEVSNTAVEDETVSSEVADRLAKLGYREK